ncbi:hypothetical protein VOLCADRAFT_70347 [Volvox carteri f. nagariensis]|uniref:threonine--tRNA ligase n=1 Tax=Volvox carteri f. nagariensis TaxID=3068 RepID=D8UK85_VOLCA|nr:uncharacterized protein VOLCADRAFT_70347 [Volvox carteri f. nagariensis]EFJ39869.1 hypothetical protein VOLCADRAFT_70347 [Volvox carteri f. nagariensis]|eukprot:XP_002959075.1 hypothetical protein VOLCADRAFT_70347 [Volvox carteri f. nagariensis]
MELKTSDESEQLLRIRHSCAHIMAMAVQRLYKGVQVTIGPWTDRGFFYDFHWPADSPITEKDLKKIKKEMAKIIRADLPFVREEVTPEEAEARIRAAGEPYKLEILQSILQQPLTEPFITPWWDLCAGPHVNRTGDINPDAVELESIAGAYWRGNEQNEMLTRIYGTAWETPEQLKAYEQLKEEAAKRDHRKLGTELNLFSIQENSGGGLVYWHPKGALVRHLIETFWKELHLSRGYQLVYSPHIAKADLWRTSGHLEFYKENMYEQMKVEDESYQLRPMNCPFHISVYKDGYYSYRDLPLRLAELGTVYRYERSGTMHGLFRVRGFTQDDAHIFCLPNQITSEIKGVLDLVEETLGTFGFHEYEINLSTRPEKSVGDDVIWSTAEAALVEALGAKGWNYQVDAGGGAFYGPKIDIKIRDAIGRKWQCSTIQLDFNLPERLVFAVAITLTPFSAETPAFLNCCVLPFVRQVRLLTVNDTVAEYARDVAAQMKRAGIRVEVVGEASMGKLIRNAEKAKIPVICVVGVKEADGNSLSVRLYGGKELGALPTQVRRRRKYHVYTWW